MSLPYANPVSPGPVAGPWRRLAGVAKGLRVILILTAVANGLLIAALLALHRTVDNFLDGDGSLGAVDDAVDFANLATFLVAAFTITVFVLTIVWEWRLAKNHELLGRPGTTFGPGWAIGAWFIPLANLVLPILQFKDLWKGSDPGLPRGSEEWKRRPVAGLLWVWWAAFVGSIVLDWASVFNVDDNVDEVVDVNRQLDRVVGLGIAAYALRIVAAILFIVVVRRLTERQEQSIAAAPHAPWAGAPAWPAATAPWPSAGTGWPPSPGQPGYGTPGYGTPGYGAPPSAAPPNLAPIAPPADRAPGWKPDPTGRGSYRYWDGARWTNHAATGGAVFDSPM